MFSLRPLRLKAPDVKPLTAKNAKKNPQERKGKTRKSRREEQLLLLFFATFADFLCVLCG
jgi:hypothetical protein